MAITARIDVPTILNKSDSLITIPDYQHNAGQNEHDHRKCLDQSFGRCGGQMGYNQRKTFDYLGDHCVRRE